MRVTWQRNKRVEDFGTELRTQASSLFRTAAAVVWLLSIFQSRRGKRDKPEDVASTCPVSVKTHLQTYFAVFHVVEKKGKKLRPHKRAPKELDRFLILQLGRRERERERIWSRRCTRFRENLTSTRRWLLNPLSLSIT